MSGWGIGSVGSSPRGRGGRDAAGRARRGQGLIPAWAGRSWSRGGGTDGIRAHPRVGGEVSRASGWGIGSVAHPRVGGEVRPRSWPTHSGWGSSPRGRGGRPAANVGRGCPGLIPAWAGRSPMLWPRPGRCRAHPRVGGEVSAGPAGRAGRAGSSPRGRGGPRAAADQPQDRGLIPAWAGRSDRRAFSWLVTRAHPRVGGEVAGYVDVAIGAGGSSPRGRGGPPDTSASRTPSGLIPAWAGRSAGGRTSCWRSRAHPRVGGEVASAYQYPCLHSGSSPRGRGGPAGHPRRADRPGLIPAWAGRSTSTPTAPSRVGAHPRVGGEVSSASWRRLPTMGSSPRGRGGPSRCADERHHGGLIPAWAGRSIWPSTPHPTSWAHPRVGGEVASSAWVRERPKGSSPRGRGGPSGSRCR